LQYPLFEPPAVWSLTQVADLPDWEGAARLGLDTETKDPNLHVTGPSVRTGGYVVGISFAVEDGPSHYLPIRHEAGGNLPPPEVIAYLRDQAARYTGILVGANLNYDLDYLAEMGIVFPKISGQRDVQIADPLIYELHDSYSLEAIAGRWGFSGKNEEHLRRAAAAYGIKADEVKESLWRMPGTHVGPYACDDAALPLRILRRQEKEIDDKSLWRVFDVESRLQPILLRMTRHGVKVDRQRLTEIGEWALQEELRQLDEIFRLSGRRLKAGDVNSKGPLIPILRDLGIRLGQTEKTRQPKIDAAALDEANHPVAKAIVRARKVNKLRTTFCASIERHLVGDRIHCQYSQIRSERRQGDERGPRWGRISASDPNLQQQPARDDFAGRWRSIYVPDDPSLLWVSADFSQNEPRILTHYAEGHRLPRAREMAEEYRTNPKADNHNMMTVLIHPEYADMDPKDPVFDAARSDAKIIFLSRCYGAGDGSIARKLGLPTYTEKSGDGVVRLKSGPEGLAVLSKFHRKVPYVRGMAQLTKETAGARGYIRTILGRRCHFPRRPDGSYDWTNNALNRLIQGSAGDQIKLALVALGAAGLDSQVQVHDEVVGGYPNMEAARAVQSIMEQALKLRVPSRVDLAVGPSWGQAQKVK
jgi:DNA polymerase I-like protein with 3'-5' exonuclease and polymerase domains